MAETEWWQRGPVDGVPAMLQPIAHILLQVRESVAEMVEGLTDDQWNARPAGIASVAFHVRHIPGVVDRLFTYARGEALTDDQFAALRREREPLAAADDSGGDPSARSAHRVAVDELRRVDPRSSATAEPSGARSFRPQ